MIKAKIRIKAEICFEAKNHRHMPAVFFTFPLSHCEATKYGAEKVFAAACLLMKCACPGL